jgi:hypothetical protein
MFRDRSTTPLLRRPSTALAVVVAAVMLAGSLISPAFGGPSLLSIKRSATQALKVAKAADKRSRKALSEASKPGPRGPEGPQGPAGPGGGGAGGSAGSTAVDFRENAPVSGRVIYNRGGLVLTASCTAGPNLDVRATTSVDHSALHVAVVFHGASTQTVYLQKNDFLTTGVAQSITNITDGGASSTGGHLQGSLTFSTPTGTITTLTYAAEQGAFGGASAKGCWFGGMAETNA